jgi:leukotriene-A4 hydrolase
MNPPRHDVLAALAVALLVAPGSLPAQVEVRDPHSFSRPDEILVTHMDLDLTVDFATRRLAGRVDLTVERRNPGAEELLLDTRDLEILTVRLDGARESVPFRLSAPLPHLGRSLAIPILGETRKVRIEYRTSPDAAALQWLEPAQTAGGRHPFLFSQSQAILARTWVPCQDTPSVRTTYDATLRVPPDLLALMSAENPRARRADGVYRFRMDRAIPSYLLAIAVGDLEFRPLGRRTGVYAEPPVVESAAAEMVDVDRMMAAAEQLYGPYRWGRYDILFLPPSFPYGGMENPRLTFATPTILAGDRSLVALVAHELAHSWSGNLVTNATWNDFWLNEGFTSYIENRIMEEVYGAEHAGMLAQLSRRDLEEEIARLGPRHRDTWLYLDLSGRDPDEGTGAIAYDKGALLLHTLETTVGRRAFDAFLRRYFDAFAFRSLTSHQFVDFVEDQLLGADSETAPRFDVRAWVFGPGIPPGAYQAGSEAFVRVERELARFHAGARAAELDTTGWVTQQWQHFLANLGAVDAARLADLDAAFGFTRIGNSEVLTAWLLHTIRAGYRPADEALASFLIGMGRRKFLRPLYAELAKTPAGRERALTIYRAARPGYHAVSRATIDALLDWKE